MPRSNPRDWKPVKKILGSGINQCIVTAIYRVEFELLVFFIRNYVQIYEENCINQ